MEQHEMTTTQQPKPQDISTGQLERKHEQDDSRTTEPKNIVESQSVVGYNQLNQLDELLIQRANTLDTTIDWNDLVDSRGARTYTVKNSAGETIYNAIEQSDRCCYSSSFCQGFEVKVVNNAAEEVLRVHSFSSCGIYCMPLKLRNLTVTRSGDGQILGHLVEEWTLFKPVLIIRDVNGKNIFKLTGQSCSCSQNRFELYSFEKKQTCGEVQMKWSSSDDIDYDDHLTLASFLIDTPLDIKATLLGALFLLDIDFFDRSCTRTSEN